MTIGAPLPRPDGHAKVTGRARYTADQFAPGMLYAALVTAPVPAGRVTAVDPTAAMAEHGVVRVLTHADMPRLGSSDAPMMAQSFVPMQDVEVRFEGQPVAIVLGETP